MKDCCEWREFIKVLACLGQFNRLTETARVGSSPVTDSIRLYLNETHLSAQERRLSKQMKRAVNRE